MKFKEQVISYPTPTFLQSLWLEDKHCRCCGKPTRLIKIDGGKQPPDMATIEHKYPKGHSLRDIKHPLYDTSHLVRTLYCWKCNQEGGIYFQRTGELYSYLKTPEYAYLEHRIRERRRKKRTTKYQDYILIPKHKSLIPYGRYEMDIHAIDSRHAMCDSGINSRGQQQGQDNYGMYLPKVRPPYYPRHGYNCWGAE